MRIAALATRQHGVITVRQLLALGLSRAAIQRRVAAGRLIRLYRGVYAVGHRALTADARRLAAVLACGEGAVLSGLSAGALHGLLVDSSASWNVTAPRRGGRAQPTGVRLHRTRQLTVGDVTTVRRIPVTTVPRTLVDLAGVLDARGLQRAVHEAEVLRVLDVDAVVAVMDRLGGRRGTATLRDALGVSVPDVDNSTFVAAFLELCDAHGLPRPATNVHHDTGLTVLGESDLVYQAARLIVELDGAATHLTRKRFEEDRRRDAYLAARGWLTLRYTWRRVTQEPATVAAEVRRVMALRTA